ncbi:MAG: cupin domain-containing protein [Anaerolineales bacterium]|nr:cupin domain-containing protein [Anaerolineales bacterium]MCK4978404.1 cupin domain-containing protein [Anaerolineales bacterium]
MYFYNKESKPAKQIFEGIWARSFWGNNIMLVMVDLEQDAILPNHSHPHEQGGIVIEGELEFTIAGETRLLHPGDLYLIPGNVEHSVKVGSVQTKVLDVFHPIREDFK